MEVQAYQCALNMEFLLAQADLVAEEQLEVAEEACIIMDIAMAHLLEMVFQEALDLQLK
jgi:hypothetical protein